MKKIKKIVIIAVIGVLAACGIGYGLYSALVSDYALSISEKKWIDTNSSNVISVAIPNDLPVFGSTGEGVFFDFADHLVEDVGLNINKDTVSFLSNTSGYGFEVSDTYHNDGLIFFKDHYVLVSKNTGLIVDTKSIPNLAPGILTSQSDKIKKYYNTGDEKFKLYESYANISEDLTNGNLQYALVSLTEYKDELIGNGINVIAHISDLNRYYYLRLGNNKTINSILTKEFHNFKNNYFEQSFNKNNYNLFISVLNISEAEAETLTDRVYKYGFMENRPYEILASGEYGGITAAFLESFSKFAGVEFTYKKYKTSTDLAQAAITGKIDMYYNYYNILTNFIDSGALKEINYYVIAHNKIDLNLSNIRGLSYQTVYVLKDSYLYNLIQNLEGINIITYEKPAELKNIIKKESILLVDESSYDYYINKISNSYSVRYKDSIDDETYTFRYKTDQDTFYKLFNLYTKTIDPQDLLRKGITSYNKVDNKGKIIGTLAIYILATVAISFIAVFFIRKDKKQVKLNTKVKKEDRLKYIDLLTSLKNRNYYNEKLNIWNKNTIYPQACIVMDLNRVKELNDSLGHEEGDKQIQAVANILIHTQIDNTEVMRTDGNEFLVYAVGYSEKQIVSYIKKLLKEFKKLPYDYGVAIGFSMILDDTKLVEDAFNEASILMRENKEKIEGSHGKKD